MMLWKHLILFYCWPCHRLMYVYKLYFICPFIRNDFASIQMKSGVYILLLAHSLYCSIQVHLIHVNLFVMSWIMFPCKNIIRHHTVRVIIDNSLLSTAHLRHFNDLTLILVSHILLPRQTINVLIYFVCTFFLFLSLIAFVLLFLLYSFCSVRCVSIIVANCIVQIGHAHYFVAKILITSHDQIHS